MYTKDNLSTMRRVNYESQFVEKTTIDAQGRPSTKPDDTELITDLTDAEIQKVMDWVDEYVTPADTVFSQSSYGIKDKVKHDTGIYLTNNQFKDLMLINGYFPVNTKELNWSFRIDLQDSRERKLTRIRESNAFVAWLFDKYGAIGAMLDDLENPNEAFKDFGKNPRGCLVRDILYDADFPVETDYNAVMSHLSNKGAGHEAKEALNEAWIEFLRENPFYRDKAVSEALGTIEDSLRSRNWSGFAECLEERKRFELVELIVGYALGKPNLDEPKEED